MAKIETKSIDQMNGELLSHNHFFNFIWYFCFPFRFPFLQSLLLEFIEDSFEWKTKINSNVSHDLDMFKAALKSTIYLFI